MTRSSLDPVLVVGAGPVGLAAAAFLAHAGTPVRIIDANDAPTTLSKALVLWRRSLVTLAPLIPPSVWASIGEPVRAACFADGGAVIATVNLQDDSQADVPPAHLSAAATATAATGSEPGKAAESTQHTQQQHNGRAHALPAGMLVVQADVETALLAFLRDRFGITVQRNTSLTAFTVADDSSSVLCTLTDTSNSNSNGVSHSSEDVTRTQIRASYLLGCDGGRSAVRKLLGCHFDGTTLDQRWLIGDFKYELDESINTAHKPQHPCEGSLQPGTLFISPSDVGVVGLIPLARREGCLRVIWNADTRCPGQPSMQDFQQLLTAQTRQQIRLTEPLWLSDFKVNERQVQRYLHHHGRVLLAGDAAHLHSPAGGQGMNTGLQDAANLAWKLSLVAAGEAAARGQLLETYQEERHPVGAQVIRMSGLLLRANALRHPIIRMVRKWALRALLAFPAVAARMTAALAGDDISYSHCSLAAAAAAATTARGGFVTASKPASNAARQVWGWCKPGAAFPDVSVELGGVEQPAVVLLQSRPGCCGTLVLMPAAQQQEEVGTAGTGCDAALGEGDAVWPSSWGHWPLNIVHVKQQQQQQQQGSKAAGAAVAVDAWGLLVAAVGGRCDAGVLVRPDGVVAAVGGPADVNSWLAKHVLDMGEPAACT